MEQRGKLLTYDAATGNGLVALIDDASTSKLPFAIDAWHSAEPPRVGMVVDVIPGNGTPGFRPVAEADLVKEKLGHLGQQWTRTVEQTLAGDSARLATSKAASVSARLGKTALAGYAVYAGATVFANFATVRVMGMGSGTTLYDLSTVLAQTGGGSGLRFLLWLSYASLALPLVWTDRKAWLAHCMPLAAVLLCLYSVKSALSDLQQRMGQLLGAGNAPSFSDFLSFGAGFWVCLLAGAVLAIHGVVNARRAI